MKIQNVEELIESVKKLNNLLSDPQWGLLSWCQMYGELMQSISSYWMEN